VLRLEYTVFRTSDVESDGGVGATSPNTCQTVAQDLGLLKVVVASKVDQVGE
jgi:hypothetical protein